MDKYSSCCGVEMNSDYADRLICPDCKEHCSVEVIKKKTNPLENINPVISSEELRNGRTDEEQTCHEINTESLWD